MELVLNEDQELIAKTAIDFANEHSPVSRFRALRDAGEELGYSKALFREMAELGWAGIPFDEVHGGAGMGLAEFALIVEALGRNLAPEPFLGNVAMAGSALALSGNAALQKKWLPGLIDGSKVLALPHQEAKSRYDLFAIETRAEAKGDGFQLTGEKVHALDAFGADALIIPARVSGASGDRDGISLFLVETSASGVSLERQQRVDHRNAATVRLEGVQVGSDALLSEEGGALLESVIDRATVVLCAEMLGGMSEAFDLTVEYLKTRDQFGVKIGTFQALKHRAAEVYMKVELSRSTVMAAARAIDAGDPEAVRLVSLAKARCSEAYVHATNEGVQIFAGVGMTDEYDIGFYMKRARAAELTFGDAAFHRARWAALGNY